MSLTKFTTHLDERHSWRHSWLVHIIVLCRHLENTLCQLGSRPPPRGCDIIKRQKCSAPAQLDEILSVPPLLLPALPALAECLQCVPDESPRASWAEGREGVLWSARSRRHGGGKGTSNPSAWQAIWNKHVYLRITWHLLNLLLGLLIDCFRGEMCRI